MWGGETKNSIKRAMILRGILREIVGIARSRLTPDQLYDTHQQAHLERKLDRIARLGAQALEGEK